MPEQQEEQRIAGLWQEYARSHDMKVRDELLMHYLPLVKYVVGRVGANLPQHVDRSDLISIGIIGLVDAVSRFDPSKQIKFETFASPRIKGQIIDHFRAMDWVPRTVRTKITQMEKCYEDHLVSTGRRADEKQICKALDISSQELVRLLEYYTSLHLLSLNQLLDNDPKSSQKMELGEIVKDTKARSPKLAAQYHEMRDLLALAINELSDQERMAVVLYYYQELMLKEIGMVLGVSESRVSQIIATAMVHLRAKLKKYKEMHESSDKEI